ncbi:MAG: DUF1836 domain-containing protein [bacterium]
MKDFSNIHILRWEEIPDFPLYIDQVVSIIEKSLDFLIVDEKDKIITNTMINNYVKSGIVDPPVKKRYNKVHVAYFIIVCILKKVYSLDEISKLILLQIIDFPTDHAYNSFCDLFELYLKNLSQEGQIVTPTNRQEELLNLFHTVIRSVVYCIYVQHAIVSEKTIQEIKKENTDH